MIKKIIFAGLIFICSNLFSQVDSSNVSDDHSDTTNTKFNIPIFSTSGADADSDMDNQDASGLLQSSRDVFAQFASFQFGVARYRMRGYAQENQLVLINGINVNNLETGTSSWSSWGGLNDVTRFNETRFGNGTCRVGFSGAGGYSNIDSKAGSFRKGTRISYASANRVFRHRVMVTHSTGQMQNGWAFTISASSRQGNQVYIPGTYINANSFYGAIDKRWTDKHITSLVAFVAPAEQGRSSAALQEAFDLTGTNYYNSLWGYQNGVVRNSSVAKTVRPMVILSHLININVNTKLTTSAFFNWGKYSLSGLNWNNSPNPRPDYYRYLPSYYYNQMDMVNGDIRKNLWQNDPDGENTQINWDRLIAMNQANLYTDPKNAGAINTTETRSRYILEDRVDNLKNGGLNITYNTRLDKLFLSGGVNINIYKNNRYKTLNDLLGGTFWLDYDQFATNLGVDASFQQNDLDNPDKKIYKGDKFGFDYTMNVNREEVWGQAEYSFAKVDVYGGLTISNSQIWRTGNVANGKFPLTSKGESEKLNYMNYGAKGGLVYKINGRNFLTASGSYLTRPPEVNNLFLSPRTRNDLVKTGSGENIGSESVLSYEASYLAKYPGFKARVTYYNTIIQNQIWFRSFWSDEFNNNVNYIMTGVDQKHEGLEIGVEKTLFTSHTIQGALGYGNFAYTKNTTAQAWQDNNNTQLFTDRTAYIKNYRIGGTPQTVAGIGYKYSSPKRWFVGVNYNYFSQTFLEPNPDRRTPEAVSKYEKSDPMYNQIVDQGEINDYFLINANGGMSFRIKRKYFVNVNVSVNNILNNKEIRNWGFESMRWDYSSIDKFPNKYQYMPGTTYMAMINFSF
ncbi:MAG: TonB-dependent receptor [Bacteroidota bacterium]|nr:TonB-dependent receptor [Bacteroidota bacterium]